MDVFTIDQSGKIEETNKDTVLAFSSNKTQFSILIPCKLKQEIFLKFDKKLKKKITLRLFSYGLFLLLKDRANNSSIIHIDNEYDEHDKDIKQMLINYSGIKKENIKFINIGKDANAHKVAYKTFKKKMKPNEIINELDINKIFSNNQLKKLLKRKDA